MTAPLSPGTHTILAFGDSTTAPRTVAGAPVPVYADLLRAELPAWGITGTVLNRGVPGNTTADAMARFDTDVLAHHPDLTIIQFGINDAAVDVWKDPPATTSRVALRQYVANLTAMIRQLREAGSQVILMTPNPGRWTPELRALYGRAAAGRAAPEHGGAPAGGRRPVGAAGYVTGERQPEVSIPAGVGHDSFVGRCWEPPFKERRFPNPPSNLFVPCNSEGASTTSQHAQRQ